VTQSTLLPEDIGRLNTQRQHVLEVVDNGEWWTLAEIADETGYPEASISARLRDFRKARYGGFTVLRERMPGTNGLHQYKLLRGDK
jgi:hypothetical protein